MECRFCNIEEAQKQWVHEVRSRTIVIFSNPRLMPGHVLVLPKRHVEKLHELDKEEHGELFSTAIEYQKKILERIAPGCDMRQHCRPFLPENDLKVDHVHIHLQPRFFEDELYQKAGRYSREIFNPLQEEEFEKYSKILSES